MNSYFHKIGRFDIDSKLLYDEWLTVANKHDLFHRTLISTPESYTKEYCRLRINYVEPNIDPVMDEILRPNYDISTNFVTIKDFQGSYTEQIANNVTDFLHQRFPKYRVTFIKYQSLNPKSSMAVHTDRGHINITFILFVWVKPGCYMQVLDEKINMADEGALYKLNFRVQHGPVNDSNEHRLCMFFEVMRK